MANKSAPFFDKTVQSKQYKFAFNFEGTELLDVPQWCRVLLIV